MYDTSDGYMLLFGGVNGRVLNDTWKFAAGHWTKILNLGHGTPPSRQGPAMVYDPRDGYVLLFGGTSFNLNACVYGCPLNDTWTYHAGRWTNITGTAGSPPAAREGMSLTYDAANRTVIGFGGMSGCCCVCSTFAAYNATWRFSSGKWAPLNNASAPYPVSEAGLAYYPTTHRTILYGGRTQYGGVLNETFRYRYASGSWILLSLNPHPTYRSDGMVYDSMRASIILIGDGASNVLGAHEHTWSFSLGVWANLRPLNPPSQRDDPAIGYDPAGGYVVFFGGDWSNGFMNDTWTLT